MSEFLQQHSGDEIGHGNVSEREEDDEEKMSNEGDIEAKEWEETDDDDSEEESETGESSPKRPRGRPKWHEDDDQKEKPMRRCRAKG